MGNTAGCRGSRAGAADTSPARRPRRPRRRRPRGDRTRTPRPGGRRRRRRAPPRIEDEVDGERRNGLPELRRDLLPEARHRLRRALDRGREEIGASTHETLRSLLVPGAEADEDLVRIAVGPGGRRPGSEARIAHEPRRGGSDLGVPVGTRGRERAPWPAALRRCCAAAGSQTGCELVQQVRIGLLEPDDDGPGRVVGLDSARRGHSARAYTVRRRGRRRSSRPRGRHGVSAPARSGSRRPAPARRWSTRGRAAAGTCRCGRRRSVPGRTLRGSPRAPSHPTPPRDGDSRRGRRWSASREAEAERRIVVLAAWRNLALDAQRSAAVPRAGVADRNPEGAVDEREALRPAADVELLGDPARPRDRCASRAPRNSLLTHTASRPTAIPDGPSARADGTVAVTTPRAGSMRETVPSGELTTHTPSAVAATPAAPRPDLDRADRGSRAGADLGDGPDVGLLTQIASSVQARREGWLDSRTVGGAASRSRR